MARYLIEDELQMRELEGDLIAGTVSNRPHPVTGKLRARWTELTLYRSDAGGYVLHKVNRSRVWHLPDAKHVRIPALVAASSLPDDAVYCAIMPPRDGREQCRVITAAAVPDMVLTEQPQFAVFRCGDHDAVIGHLAKAFRRISQGAESDPVRELLAEAARNDPAFAAPGKPVLPI